MFLDELLNRDQGISVHRKHMNTLLTGIYKTKEKPFFSENYFPKKRC